MSFFHGARRSHRSSEDRTDPEPWLRYDAQQAATIAGFVAKSSPSQAEEVRTYEQLHGNRAEVIAAADRRIAKWNV